LESKHAGITGHAENTGLLNASDRNLPTLNYGQIVLTIHIQTKQMQIIQRIGKMASWIH